MSTTPSVTICGSPELFDSRLNWELLKQRFSPGHGKITFIVDASSYTHGSENYAIYHLYYLSVFLLLHGFVP